MRHVIRWGRFILSSYLMVGLGMEADKEFLLPHPVSLPFVVGFLEALIMFCFAPAYMITRKGAGRRGLCWLIEKIKE